jgi:hypothetical protein
MLFNRPRSGRVSPRKGPHTQVGCQDGLSATPSGSPDRRCCLPAATRKTEAVTDGARMSEARRCSGISDASPGHSRGTIRRDDGRRMCQSGRAGDAKAAGSARGTERKTTGATRRQVRRRARAISARPSEESDKASPIQARRCSSCVRQRRRGTTSAAERLCASTGPKNDRAQTKHDRHQARGETRVRVEHIGLHIQEAPRSRG